VCSRLDELNVQGNRNLLAAQDSTGFQRAIPSQTEILAIDVRGRR
jgi:hypothetical protein